MNYEPPMHPFLLVCSSPQVPKQSYVWFDKHCEKLYGKSRIAAGPGKGGVPSNMTLTHWVRSRRGRNGRPTKTLIRLDELKKVLYDARNTVTAEMTEMAESLDNELLPALELAAVRVLQGAARCWACESYLTESLDDLHYSTRRLEASEDVYQVNMETDIFNRIMF